jgi:hypothetical protein
MLIDRNHLLRLPGFGRLVHGLFQRFLLSGSASRKEASCQHQREQPGRMNK